MPNWCSNEINVVGSNEDIVKLIEFVQTEDSDFALEKVIPYPEEYAKMDAEKEGSGYNAGGYRWCLDHWGTKWEIEDVYTEHISDQEISFLFDTAWSPCVPVTIALSKLFPSVKFTHRFEEGGCDFSGIYVLVAGEYIDSADGVYGQYRINPDEYYEEDETDL